MSNEQILTITYDNEVGVYVAKCQLPPIYSQGKTKTEAFNAIGSAVKLWVKTFFEEIK